MEMKKYKLGDCLKMIENGVVIKQEKGAGGFPITRIETLSNDKFNRDRLGYANIDDITKYSHFILNDKDLLMSHINSRTFIGRTVLYRKKEGEQIIHGMNVLRLKTDGNKLNPIFAYYYFKTPNFRTAIDHIRKDAINQSSLSIQDINNIDIFIPSITEQNIIADFLYNLERKTNLNSAINQNLRARREQRRILFSLSRAEAVNGDVSLNLEA
jgi:type I restriction enzyme S subunit